MEIDPIILWGWNKYMPTAMQYQIFYIHNITKGERYYKWTNDIQDIDIKEIKIDIYGYL